MNISDAEAAAKQALSDERFHHTECVAEAARRLAERFGGNVKTAVIAAYLHDIAKEFGRDRLLQIIEGSDIIETDLLLSCPSVWHSFAGAVYAKKALGITDEIAGAICYHTTGRADMSLLEKIVFLADYISADRDEEYAGDVRRMLDSSGTTVQTLDEIVFFVVKKQLAYLMAAKRPIHLDSVRAYNYFALTINTNGDRYSGQK